MKKFIAALLVMVLMLSSTLAYAQESYTFFELSEANGANSKFFMLNDSEEYKAGEEYTDYVLGLDYEGTLAYDSERQGIYPTGTSADVLAKDHSPGAIVYTIDGTDNNASYNKYVNFVTKDGKPYWNINGVDYLMNPLEKVIKLYTKVKTDDVEDEALKARFDSLNAVTLDVENGNYSSVGFLAGTSYARNLSVTYVYTDGTKSTETKQKISVKTADDIGQSVGVVYMQSVKTHAIAALSRKFAPYVYEADINKEIDKIILKSDYYSNAVIIISAWGNKATTEMFIDELLDKADENYIAEDEIAKIDKINSMLEEEGKTAGDLAPEYLEKLNKAKVQIVSYVAENLPETVTDENLETALNEIANVNKAASDYGVEVPADIKAQINNLETQISKLYVTYSPYVDLSILSGANSKMFVKHEDEIKIEYNDMLTQEYNYIKDYINLENYETVVVWGNKTEGAENYNADATPWAHYPIPYSFELKGGSYAKYIPLDKDGKWNIMSGEETFKFYIDTVNNKAINLKKVSDKYIVNYSDEQKAELKSMLTATVDIDNECYEEIKFLAGTMNSQTAPVNVLITYTDGSEETVETGIIKPASVTESTSGYINAGGGRCFNIITLYPDTTKPVESLKFTLKETNREVVILSMLGKVASPKTIIENLPKQITLDNYNSAVASKNYLESLIAEKGADLESNQAVKEMYDAFLTKLSEGLFIGEISYTGTQIVIPYANHTDEDVEFVVFATTTDSKEVTIKSIPLKAVATKNTADGEVVIDYVNDCENKAQMKIFAVRQLNSIKPMGNPITVDLSQVD